MRFNKGKCRVLHVGWGKPWHQYRVQDEGIETSPAKEDFRVLVDEKLDMTCTAMCTHRPEGEPYPGLHQVNRGQQVKGGDSAPLLHSFETPPGSPASSSGALSTGKTWTCLSSSRGSHKNARGNGTPAL